jgi:hypothetical protein
MTIANSVWPFVIIGRGSAAAYYLGRLKLADYTGTKILVVGEEDAWAGKRGHSGNPTDATLKINHPRHMIAHPGKDIPAYSKTLVDRLDWAAENKKVFEDASKAGLDLTIYGATVTKISEQPLPQAFDMKTKVSPLVFKIDLEEGPRKVKGPRNSLSVFAYKVVVCAGAGGHRVPDALEELKKNYPQQVIDLDEFAKFQANRLNSNVRVMVIGANAAIDAVHKALNYRCTIQWLIDTKAPNKPAMLTTQPRMLSAWEEWEKQGANLKPDDAGFHVYRVEDYSAKTKAYGFERREASRMIMWVQPSAGAKVSFRTDYIVYGIGPTGKAVDMIDGPIMAQLKPIEDRTRSLDGGKGPHAAIIGYEGEGTGLFNGIEVFGTMSGQVGRTIATTSKERVGILRDHIDWFRKTYDIYMAIQTAGLPGTPAFAEKPETLATMDRGELRRQLLAELSQIMAKNPTAPELKPALETLANQILAYHTAAAFAKRPVGGADDPNSQKGFTGLLNRVTTHLPKGTVGDSGQLASIRAQLGAYATMNGNLPAYMPRQEYTMRGPQNLKQGEKAPPIDVKTIEGKFDFNLANMQDLAIFVCVSYPSIPPGEANAFVQRVMDAHHESADGFTTSQVNGYMKELSDLERKALGAALSKV